MLLLIDNYDSFTFNLHQLVAMTAAEACPGLAIRVFRNDQITVKQALELAPTHLLISPGPCTPLKSGISIPLIRAAAEHRIPLLGVCLGHQCIGATYGGTVGPGYRVVHGKPDLIHHDARRLFAGLPTPFMAARYHSLAVDRSSLRQPDLEVTAWTAEGEIMGLRHRRLPIEGVQFHPESFMSEHGRQLMGNFLAMQVGVRWPPPPAAAVPAVSQGA